MDTQQTDVSSGVMDESEVCSLPGGLASVRRQFETQETATSHNVTQFHFHHRSVQEVSNSEVTVTGSVRQVIPANQQIHFYQDDMVTHEENNLTSSYDNHEQEADEDLPRLTTKELRDRFEKNIEEAAPSKKVKVRVPKSELCSVCRRRVYPMEALIADRKKFHKSCFCCEHCRSKLSLGNYVSLHGHLFCLHHYKQLLKSKGNHGNGLGQTLPAGSSLIPTPDQLNWRYSISQSSVSSLDTSHALEKEFLKPIDETKHNSNKISVTWPPQTQPPKKAFQLEEDIKLIKPLWPPQEDTSMPPKHQHRKVVPRSIL